MCKHVDLAVMVKYDMFTVYIVLKHLPGPNHMHPVNTFTAFKYNPCMLY